MHPVIPLRRPARFHNNPETLASSKSVSPKCGKRRDHLLHCHQGRVRAGKGGNNNVRVSRRSSQLNHMGEDVLGVKEEEIAREEKNECTGAVECRRGRSKRQTDSTSGMTAVSFMETNKEGEPNHELRRSKRLIDTAAVEVNAIQSPMAAVKVVRGMDAHKESTPERNGGRKKRKQKGEPEKEVSTPAKKASRAECTGKNVETYILAQPASKHQQEMQKLKDTSTKLSMDACKKKTEKPRTGQTAVMPIPGGIKNNNNNRILVHKQDTSQCGNGKGVAYAAKEGKSIQQWTSDLDKALHRAYITARPSPHFWKNVSKMVSGKSAKECFNRIHSFLTTPPAPQPRAKVNKSELSLIGEFSLSGGSSSGNYNGNIKKTRSTKQKKLIAQKTVRHILKKQSLQEQAQETDLFPVFISSLNISAEELPTTCVSPTPACQLKFSDSPNSGNADLQTAKKSLSRIGKISAKKPSPEVLKQVKNMALHERYIDRLHGRVSRWKPSSKLSSSAYETQDKEYKMSKPIPIKAAKNALLFDAIEAMRQFRRSEDVGCTNGDDDDDDEGDESNESGSEDI